MGWCILVAHGFEDKIAMTRTRLGPQGSEPRLRPLDKSLKDRKGR